jgi:hypothetical protein
MKTSIDRKELESILYKCFHSRHVPLEIVDYIANRIESCTDCQKYPTHQVLHCSRCRKAKCWPCAQKWTCLICHKKTEVPKFNKHLFVCSDCKRWECKTCWDPDTCSGCASNTTALCETCEDYFCEMITSAGH